MTVDNPVFNRLTARGLLCILYIRETEARVMPKKTTKKPTFIKAEKPQGAEYLRYLSPLSTDPTTMIPKRSEDPDHRGGRPLSPPSEIEYRKFADHIDQEATGTCWEWAGAQNGAGYGQLTWRRRRHLAHRLSWALANGRWPGDLQVMHSCDNPGCVNPAHLRLGSAKENMVDAAVKGRLRRKLTPDAVRDIRASHEAGQTIWHITKRYPVSASSIRAVIEGRTWRHVDG